MLKILILITTIVTLSLGMTTGQYERLAEKERYLTKRVKELKLPKETVNVFLGMYFRESSFGRVKIGDGSSDKFYYKHKNKKTYINKSTYNKAKSDNSNKYIVITINGKKISKRIYVEKDLPNSLASSSLGDYNITLLAVKKVIDTYNLKQYYKYLSVDKKRIVDVDGLISVTLNNSSFNTDIALYYFKMNYEEAKRRGLKDPFVKAISRHNGGWNNAAYVNKIKSDSKFALARLREIKCAINN